MACITGLSHRIKGRFKRRRQPRSGSEKPSDPSHTVPFDSGTSHQEELLAGKPVEPDPGPRVEEPNTSGINADHSATEEAPSPTSRDTGMTRSQGRLSLWEQALKGLSAEEQTAFRSLVPRAGPFGTSETQGGSMPDAIHEAIAAMKSQQKKYEESSRTDLRELTTKVVKHLTQAGDFAINFAPSIAQQIWPIGKWLLQIPVATAEQMGELLKIADIVCHVFAVGCVYETYYTEANTPRDGLGVLHHALIKVYQCALQSLAIAAKLMSTSEMARIGNSLWSPGAVKEKVDQFPDLLNDLSHAVQSAQAAKSSKSEVLLSSYLEKWKFSVAEVDSKLLQLLKGIDSNDERQLLNWVSTVEVGDDLKSLVDRRAPDTCQWILTNDTFRKWEKSRHRSGLVWLQGAVGTGKSYLTAKVVQGKKTFLEGPNDQTLKHEGLAFFFFNRNDEGRRTTLSCLKSLIRQLSKPYDPALNLLQSLEELRDRCFRGNRSLSIEDCKTQLQHFIATYHKITLVIDAIDECDPGDKYAGRLILLELLGDLVNNNTTRGFKVFVSGRPEADILATLKDRETIMVNENQGDIRKFLEHKIECDSKWIDDSLKAEVTETIAQKCKSVFRLAQLQIAHLIQFPFAIDVRRELDKLPLDLKDIYDMIYSEQITKGGETAARIAKRALMWVLASEKPLTSDELLLAIRVDPVTSIVGSVKGTIGQSTSILDPTNRLEDVADLEEMVSENVLLHLCANFLTLRKSIGHHTTRTQMTEFWDFCHASVSEYLEANHFTVLEASAHVGAASIIGCIQRFGRFPLTKTGAGESQWLRALKATHDRPPLELFDLWSDYLERVDQSLIVKADAIRYSSEIAHEKYSDVRVDAMQLRDLLQRFLGDPNELSEECKIWYLYRYHMILQHENVPMSASYLMIRCNFDNLLKPWWDTLPWNRGRDGHDYPMIDTKVRGVHDPNGRYTNPLNLLQWACLWGRADIVTRLIVEAGMDPNSGDPPPLAIASDQGHLEVCKRLLENQACDPDSPRNLYNLLYRAARLGNVRMIRILLKHGASPDPSGWNVEGRDMEQLCGSPIAAAISNRHTEAMRVLIEEGGADPNISFPNARHGSAAITAASDLNFEVLEYLVSQGHIDPNAVITTGEFGSILSAAIFRFSHWRRHDSSSKMFERLAALRINFNASIRYPTSGMDRPCGSVLEYYTHERHLDRVKELIEKYGAKVDYCSEYGDFGCALIASFRWRSQRMRRYLVERAGADVNLQVPHGNYHSPLAGAAVLGDADDMDYLIQHGARVNMVLEHGQHGSALKVAAAAGMEKAVQFLFRRGADLSRPENRGWELELQRARLRNWQT